jgi:glycosyl transferase family 25
MEFIDGIVYINLKDRIDRNLHIKQELKRMGFQESKIHRIEAVYNKNCGHLGCSNSHIKAIEFAREQKWKYFLVLEDDFNFVLPLEECNKIIKCFLQNFKNNWDVFMLATIWTNQLNTHIDCIKKIITGTTTSGYIVNSNYIETLYNNFIEGCNKLDQEVQEKILNLEPNERIFDVNYALDQYWFTLQRNDRFYISQPYIGNQGGFSSSIMCYNKS